MIKFGGTDKHGIATYFLSKESEVADLPKGGLVRHGSSAFVIKASKVFMYDEESDEWLEI